MSYACLSEAHHFIIHQIKYKVMALQGHSDSLWPSNAITLYLIWWIVVACMNSRNSELREFIQATTIL